MPRASHLNAMFSTDYSTRHGIEGGPVERADPGRLRRRAPDQPTCTSSSPPAAGAKAPVSVPVSPRAASVARRWAMSRMRIDNVWYTGRPGAIF